MSREATPAEKSVFGADVRIGDDDKPIERGFGSVAVKSAKVKKLEANGEKSAQELQERLAERARLEAEARKADETAKAAALEEAAAKAAEAEKANEAGRLEELEVLRLEGLKAAEAQKAADAAAAEF